MSFVTIGEILANILVKNSKNISKNTGFNFKFLLHFSLITNLFLNNNK